MPDPIDPRHTALLLMDFQQEIVPRAPDPDALVQCVRLARERCRRSGMAVVHVRVAFTAAARAAVPPSNKTFAALLATHRLAEGTPAADIADVIDSAALADLLPRETGA